MQTKCIGLFVRKTSFDYLPLICLKISLYFSYFS